MYYRVTVYPFFLIIIQGIAQNTNNNQKLMLG